MAQTVESERESPIAAIGPEGHEYLSDAAARLDRFDAQVDAVKLSLLRMYVYVSVRPAEMRQRAIDACLAGGLLSTPIETLEGEVERVVSEVLTKAR